MSPFVVKWLRLSLISLIGCAFLALVIYALINREEIRASQVEPPLITAPSDPLKRRPDNPGGMDIANRDKMVFDLLDGDKVPTALSATVEPSPQAPTSATVQNLLAEVSGTPASQAVSQTQPQSPSAPVTKADAAPVETIAVKAPQAVVPVKVDVAPAQPVKVDVKPEPKPVAVAAAQPAPKAEKAEPVKVQVKPEAKPEPKAEAKVEPKAAAKGAWAAQVAAVSDKAAGDKLVAKLKGIPAFKGLTPRIAPVPGGKGYRVQFTGLSTREAAAAVCAKAAGQTSCFPAAVK
jgi:hypothetical protein